MVVASVLDEVSLEGEDDKLAVSALWQSRNLSSTCSDLASVELSVKLQNNNKYAFWGCSN